MKATLARVHTGLAWLALLGCILQFFMIGLSVFNGLGVEQHGNTGRMLAIVALVMLIVALIIRTSRRTTWYSVAVLLLLFPGQGFTVYLEIPGFVKALHALVGILILWLCYSLATGRAKAVVKPVGGAAPARAN